MVVEFVNNNNEILESFEINKEDFLLGYSYKTINEQQQFVGRIRIKDLSNLNKSLINLIVNCLKKNIKELIIKENDKQVFNFPYNEFKNTNFNNEGVKFDFEADIELTEVNISELENVLL